MSQGDGGQSSGEKHEYHQMGFQISVSKSRSSSQGCLVLNYLETRGDALDFPLLCFRIFWLGIPQMEEGGPLSLADPITKSLTWG